MTHDPGYYFIPYSKQLFFCDGNCEAALTWVEITDFTVSKSYRWSHKSLTESHHVEDDMILYIRLTGKVPDEMFTV